MAERPATTRGTSRDGLRNTIENVLLNVDAFSHALTNPLLSPHAFNEETFTPDGMASIAATTTSSDIAARNLPGGGRGLRISMDHPGHRSVA